MIWIDFYRLKIHLNEMSLTLDIAILSKKNVLKII